MTAFPIHNDLDQAMTNAHRHQRDALGYIRYTFRIELQNPELTVDSILVDLIDRGWQMVTSPVVVESKDSLPRHAIFSMIGYEHKGLRIEGRMNFGGEIQVD
jgi:hypothetical protein